MSQIVKFLLNDQAVEYSGNPANVLLDYIRKEKHLTGAKEVCKEGDCGACAVIIGFYTNDKIQYKLINSCLYPLGNLNNTHVITIEGINVEGFTLIQQSFVDEGSSQCGFCTPGFILAFTSYFLSSKNYNVNDAIDALGGNICRCTGYMSIKRSIENVVSNVNANWDEKKSKITNLVSLKLLPEYFKNIDELYLQALYASENVRPSFKQHKIVSGGTDLFVQIADELLDTEIIFGNELQNNNIYKTNEDIVIGGQVTFEQLNQNDLIKKYFPEINNYMFIIASLPIRNSATIAGNLCNASPIGDMTIFLLALNSRVVLADNRVSREKNLREFYLDYKKLDKSNDEYIEAIKIDIPSGKFLFNFEKISKRINLDIATVNSAISLHMINNKIVNGHMAFGGVSPIPLYLNYTSQLLQGREVSHDLIIDLIESAQKEISPISDIRGSEKYKRLLVTQMIKKHFLKLFPELISEEVMI